MVHTSSIHEICSGGIIATSSKHAASSVFAAIQSAFESYATTHIENFTVVTILVIEKYTGQRQTAYLGQVHLDASHEGVVRRFEE